VLPLEALNYFRERLFKRFDYMQGVLAGQPYLLGNAFSVADAYLFTMLGWSTFLSFDLDRWPALAAFVDRIGQRPAVQTALQVEAKE
jgi:glutathione S-transferase